MCIDPNAEPVAFALDTKLCHLLPTLSDAHREAIAHDLARTAIMEYSGEDSVGDYLGSSFDDSNAATHRFLADVAGYQGWQWAVIEMVASYGMAVGREVFDTVLWIGRFYEALSIQMAQKPRLLCRIEEKRHICHDSRANDPAIRRALIDRFATHDLKNGKGTSKNPDFFYGFKADIWAAYAVGLTAIENHNNDYRISSDC